MNDLVRDKLIQITNQGLMLKAIALNVGIDVNNLSRFKSGMECLKASDVKLLSEYLNAVSIPQWVIHAKNSETKPKRRRGQVSLDLLRELD